MSQIRLQWCDKLIEWGIILIIALLPLFFSPYNLFKYDLPKMTLLRILSILLLTVWLIKLFLQKRLEFFRTPLDLPILAFLLAGILSLIVSVNFYASLMGEARRNQGFFVLICYFFLYFLLVNFYTQAGQIHQFLIWLFTSASIISLIGVLQHLGVAFGWLHLFYGPDPSRSSASFGNPVYLGAYLVLVIPVAMAVALRGNERWLLSLLAWLVIFLGIPGLLFTFSRAAWLGLVGSMIVLVFYAIKGRLLKRRHLLAAALLVIFVMTIYFASSGQTSYTISGRAASVTEVETGTGASRLLMWETTLSIIRERPVLGYGLDSYWVVFPQYLPRNFERIVGETGARPGSPHNDLLEVAATMGLFGLLSYLWLWITFFITAILALRKVIHPEWRLLLIGLLAGISGYFIQLQFSFQVVGVAPLFWLMMALTMSIGRVESVLQPSDRDKPRPYISSMLKIEFKRVPSPVQVLIIGLIGLAALVGLRFASLPLVANWHAKRANDLSQEGFYATAVLEGERASELAPYEEEYLFFMGKIYEARAQVEGDQRWRDKAIEVYTRALDQNPLERNGYAYLGQLYLKAAEEGEEKYVEPAIIVFQELIRLEPNYSQSHYNLGVAYYLKGKLDKAISEWKETVSLKPDERDAHFLMGKAYQEQGKRNQAIDAFKKVLKLNPDDLKARQALEDLQ